MNDDESPPLWVLIIVVVGLVLLILVIGAHGRGMPQGTPQPDIEKTIPPYNDWCDYFPGTQEQKRCVQRQNLSA